MNLSYMMKFSGLWLARCSHHVVVVASCRFDSCFLIPCQSCVFWSFEFVAIVSGKYHQSFMICKSLISEKYSGFTCCTLENHLSLGPPSNLSFGLKKRNSGFGVRSGISLILKIFGRYQHWICKSTDPLPRVDNILTLQGYKRLEIVYNFEGISCRMVK